MSKTEENANTQRAHKRARLGPVIFLTLAVIATFGLAWWQWTRFQSGSGTFQNLGYALQWPLFGAFFVYAYRKYLHYENELIDAQNDEERLQQLFEADEKRYGKEITEIDEEFLPPRPQLDVETFNNLNKQHRSQYPKETEN
ncbi:hypothetical protein [Corynebacterium poyangense]|uniref:hypothetical protein n=1 Tax=Corynebacterium poyangense TaxID=2684405 RepID=UPI0037BF4E63